MSISRSFSENAKSMPAKSHSRKNVPEISLLLASINLATTCSPRTENEGRERPSTNKRPFMPLTLGRFARKPIYPLAHSFPSFAPTR